MTVEIRQCCKCYNIKRPDEVRTVVTGGEWKKDFNQEIYLQEYTAMMCNDCIQDYEDD